MNTGGRIILLAGITLFFFMLIALLMMGDALQNSRQFGEFYSELLIFNSIGLVALVVLIGINLHNLIQQLRKQVPGVRLTIRMVTMFAVLSVTPVLIVYYFSLDFLHRGIDSWFDLRVEQALDDSLELSKLSLDLLMRENLKQTTQIATQMAELTNAAVPFEIDAYRMQIGATELTLMTRQGTIISSSVGDTISLVPDQPNETIIFQVAQGNNYIGLDTVRDSGLSIRAVVNVPELGIENEPRIIQGLFPISTRVNNLADSVQSAFVKYNELSYLRQQLKISFLVILTMVLLFSIFSALWAAFYFAMRLAAPIRDLAEGTRSVAAGDYDTQLPIPSKDELGVLIASFNEMTRRIAQARNIAEQSQREAEAQRTYLETVLGKLSSGVLVLDEEHLLRTANISSGQILGINIDTVLGKSFEEIVDAYPYLEDFASSIQDKLSRRSDDWREQITFFGVGGRQVLMCSGTSIELSETTEAAVYVVVFDDITAIIQGQKDAAWSEMARRLAHEIKNPLTPIQLAAERLRHKYLPTMSAQESDVLDRLTNTIVQQVDTMKDMVNTFAAYARSPTTSLERTDLNRLVEEVADLYANLDSNAEIRLDLAGNLPETQLNQSRIRQVLNNILTNAFDAQADKSKALLEINTRRIMDTGTDLIELRIKDSGSGISGDIISTVFEPYVTTKQKGTGLGLAIVKKIVEEHNGLVWLENNRDGPGASAVIRLPALTPGREVEPADDARGIVG